MFRFLTGRGRPKGYGTVAQEVVEITPEVAFFIKEEPLMEAVRDYCSAQHLADTQSSAEIIRRLRDIRDEFGEERLQECLTKIRQTFKNESVQGWEAIEAGMESHQAASSSPG